ncbi:MAG: hypothetical protein Q9164_004836 [Protoblastenia rupestris]
MAPLITSPSLTLHPVPLASSSFAPFGSVITSPLPATITKVPYPPPSSSTTTNQNTALKYPNITPLTSAYRLSPSGTSASPRMTLFACFPRQLRASSNSSTTNILDVPILERHPYTTQTFLPLTPPSGNQSKYIVIVAPTLPPPIPMPGLTPYFPQAQQAPGLPDLQNMKAFVAEPGMGVTYGVGVWHAPMVVVGRERIDFVVSQWMSGREEEDCQEVVLDREEKGRGVEVVFGGLAEGIRAKL